MAEATKPAAKNALPENVFAVNVTNHELVKLAYDAYLANNRLASATTKERGEVRGGGIKPWKQKGTGRARFGSIRNPIWRGGGIVFGPRGNENYTKSLSKTSKRVAIRQALTLAAQAGKIIVKDVKTTGKTKEIVKFLEDNKCERKTLIVVNEKTDTLIRATSNVQSVILTGAMYLNVFHILNADHIVIAPEAIKTIENWLSKKTGEEK